MPTKIQKAVMLAIRSRSGATTRQQLLKALDHYSPGHIDTAVYRLKKMGAIAAQRRGVYKPVPDFKWSRQAQNTNSAERKVDENILALLSTGPASYAYLTQNVGSKDLKLVRSRISSLRSSNRIVYTNGQYYLAHSAVAPRPVPQDQSDEVARLREEIQYLKGYNSAYREMMSRVMPTWNTPQTNGLHV